MKKVILILLALSLVLAFASCDKKTPGDDGEEKGYGADLNIENIEDDNLNFTIDGVDNWSVFHTKKDGIPERTYYSPKDESGNSTNATITVTAVSTEGEDFNSFSENFYNSIKSTSSDFKVLTELSESKLGSYDAVYFSYSFSGMGVQKIIMEQTLMPTSDGRIFLFTCTSLADSYDNYKDIFASARESFKFN